MLVFFGTLQNPRICFDTIREPFGPHVMGPKQLANSTGRLGAREGLGQNKYLVPGIIYLIYVRSLFVQGGLTFWLPKQKIEILFRGLLRHAVCILTNDVR